MKLKIVATTNLKPTWLQTAQIVELGLDKLLVPFEKGQELPILHHSEINGHEYVVLDSLNGHDRGFFWSPAVEIFDENAKAAPAVTKQVPPVVIKAATPAQPLYPDWNLGAGDFAARIVQYMMSKGYALADGVQERTIVYIEGVDPDGRQNEDRFNEWNDLSLLLSFRNNKPYLAFKATATTEPGDYYTYNPMNPGGAFRIAFNQFKAAWQAGYHYKQWALVQAGAITGYRDLNKDGMRTGDRTDTGMDFYVNQHGPYTTGTVGRSSAGCLVRESMTAHQNFMHYLTSPEDGDPRYQRDKNYRWDTTIIDGSDFNKSKWGYG